MIKAESNRSHSVSVCVLRVLFISKATENTQFWFLLITFSSGFVAFPSPVRLSSLISFANRNYFSLVTVSE